MRKAPTRRQILSCVSAAAIFAVTGAASAQQGDDEEELEEITVSGFRSAIEQSTETKRKARGIIEAVTAEDIGKLPDVSIAETLSRLPGLATQRVNGRAQLLSIRGLGPDFSTALLNGREQVSTGDNRGIEFDIYPAEMIQQVVVYKVPKAGLIGQAIAGTVDLRTIRPLDRGETVLGGSLQYEFNDRPSNNPDLSNKGWRGSFTYADQFADDTIGLAVGAAYQKTPTQIERFNAWGYQPFNAETGQLDPGASGDDGSGPFGVKPFGISNEFERFSVTGVAEYQPNPNFRTSVDVFYADFEEESRRRGIEFPFLFLGNPQLNNPVVSDGLLESGTFSDVFGVVRNDVQLEESDLFAAGWNALWTASETLEFEADVSYSKADRLDRDIESYSGTGFNRSGLPDAITVNRRPSGAYGLGSQIDYTDRNLLVLTDPHGWGGSRTQAGFENRPATEDELWQVNLEARYRLGNDYISQIEFGANYGQRSKEREQGRFVLTLAGGLQELAIPDNAILEETARGLSFLGIPGQVSYDPLVLIENGVYNFEVLNQSEAAFPQNWRVEEDVFQGWVRADIDAEFDNGMTLTGDIGFQVVYTDQSSDGFQLILDPDAPGGSRFEPTTGGDSYWDYLPSLNLNLGLTDDWLIRFAATRTLVRARMDQLNASLDFGINGDPTAIGETDPALSAFDGSGGNPLLRPYIAETLDLSVEYYFSAAGYIALGGFYKNLSDFINSDGQIFDFSPFIQAELLPAGIDIADFGTTLGVITQPANNGDGDIYGLEATLSLPLGDLTESLEGFGIITSASYVDADQTRTNTQTGVTEAADLPGVSDWVVNATAYFEKNGFEARVSYRYRSEFLAEVPAISSQRTFRFQRPDNIWDAQIAYNFEEGLLEGARVFIQGINLTDQEFATVDGAGRLIDRDTNGATFLVGVSYNY